MSNKVPKEVIKPDISSIGKIYLTKDNLICYVIDIERDTGKPYALIGLHGGYRNAKDLFSWSGIYPVPTNALHKLINYRYDWPFGAFEYDNRIWFRIHFSNLTDEPTSSELYHKAWGDMAKNEVIDNLDQMHDKWYNYVTKLANDMELCITINRLDLCKEMNNAVEMEEMTKTVEMIVLNIINYINDPADGNTVYHNAHAHANSLMKQQEVIENIISRLDDSGKIHIMKG